MVTATIQSASDSAFILAPLLSEWVSMRKHKIWWICIVNNACCIRAVIPILLKRCWIEISTTRQCWCRGCQRQKQTHLRPETRKCMLKYNTAFFQTHIGPHYYYDATTTITATDVCHHHRRRRRRERERSVCDVYGVVSCSQACRSHQMDGGASETNAMVVCVCVRSCTTEKHLVIIQPTRMTPYPINSPRLRVYTFPTSATSDETEFLHWPLKHPRLRALSLSHSRTQTHTTHIHMHAHTHKHRTRTRKNRRQRTRSPNIGTEWEREKSRTREIKRSIQRREVQVKHSYIFRVSIQSHLL